MTLRTRFIFTLLLLLLLPCAALAELDVSLSAESLAAGSVLDFTVSGEAPSGYRYTLFHEGKELFSHETGLNFGSYIPRESGAYSLRVAPAGDDGAAVQEDFTVTDTLTCTLPDLPETLSAGKPLLLRPQVQGGTGVYTYVYTVTAPDGTASAWESSAGWAWVAPGQGSYTLTVTARDSIGASAQAEATVTVTDGPGISVKSSGGALRAHGGQQSWTVYAPGSWTATTGDDFITIDTPGGVSGSTLSITVDSPASASRKGTVLITSGDKQLEVTVAQSADHGVDEEIYLRPDASPVRVDGQAHALWLNAHGSRSFAVQAASGWTTEVQGDFIQLEAIDSQLTLTVDSQSASTARSGHVTIHGPASSAYIHVYQPAAITQAPAATAVALPQAEEPALTLYSQSSGQWKDAPYGRSTLEVSGCAIFALSHALQYLGFEGEEITPEHLAANYSFALREGGTINSTLVGNVGDDLGYKTRFELYESLPTIRQKLADGAVFSFAVVSGHIAMVAEQSEDGSMFRIIDSAPSATWERIKNAQLFRQEADGSFTPITSLAELEGIRYYIENGAFGSADYWLEASYVAKRGVRLIQPE